MSKKSEMPINRRLMLLTEKNRLWFEKYNKLLEDQNKDKSSIEQYKNIVINMMELDKTLDADKISFDLISKYFPTKDKPSRRNIKYYAIKPFLEMVNSETPLKFNILEFRKLMPKKEEMEGSLTKPIPLKIEEIIKIRRILKGDYRRLFVFEMIYQYGLKLNELELISIEKYNENLKTIKLNKNKTLTLSKRIIDTIIIPDKILNKKGKSAYSDIITEIGQKIERHLMWRDIIETRELFFFKCSICLNKYENIPDNWALIKYEGTDDSMWMVCKDCAIKGE